MSPAPFLTLLAILAAGALLIWLGLRGRRINDHPVCACCKFDLTGIYPGGVTCPECGAGLKRAKGVRKGQRRKVWTAVVVGAVGVAAAAPILGVVTIAAVSRTEINTYKPAGLLAREGRTGSAGVSEAAGRELLDRLTRRALTSDQSDMVVQTALEIQGAHDRPWSEAWREILEVARSGNMLDEEQMERHRVQAAVLDARTRPRVRAGDPVPVSVVHKETRLLGHGTRYVIVLLRAASVRGPGGARALERDPGSVRSGGPDVVAWFPLYGGSFSGHAPMPEAQEAFVLQMPADIAPGRATLEVSFVVADVTDDDLRRTPHEWSLDEVEHLTTRIVDISIPFHVAPRQAAAAELIEPTPETTEQFERILTARYEVADSLADRSIVYARLDTGTIRTPFAFDVYVREGEREHRIGSFTSGAAAGPLAKTRLWGRANAPHAFMERVPRLGGTSLQFILRPNPDLAAYTIDLEEIYGGEVVLRDVRILEGARPREFFQEFLRDAEARDRNPADRE